jgi:hypothetical protein
LPNSPTPHMSQQGNRVTDEAVPRNRLITVEIFGATDSRRLIGLIWSVPTASQAYTISAWSLKKQYAYDENLWSGWRHHNLWWKHLNI